ncbi:MAG: endonuclease [Aureispira sp.]
MRIFYTLLLVGIFLSFNLQAQYDHQDILLGESGTTLLTNLRLDYKPTIIVSYGTARDNMFSYIYEENDTVTCVYTGLKRYLPSNATSPRAIMLDNNSAVSVNTEHTYPQSKALNSAGRSDLHHIFPTRALANNGRSTLPFGEISVNNVDKWYKDAIMLTAPPAVAEQPLYSKQQTGVMFEPREDHKGNVARAMFYFYTMYRNEADGADPNYFNQQKNILCQWHLDDPVDSMEWVRTSRIALFQNNRVNPFVMDCTLPQRCNYCTQTCSPPNSITRQEDFGLFLFDNAPNPVSHTTQLSYQLQRTQEITLRIHNHLGQVVKMLVVAEEQVAGSYHYSFDASTLPSGLYSYSITIGKAGRSATFSKTMIVSH